MILNSFRLNYFIPALIHVHGGKHQQLVTLHVIVIHPKALHGGLNKDQFGCENEWGTVGVLGYSPYIKSVQYIETQQTEAVIAESVLLTYTSLSLVSSE